MTATLSNEIITAFVVGSVVLCVSAMTYFAKAWVATLNATIKELSSSVHELTGVVHELRQEQALQRLRFKHQEARLRELQAQAVFCSREECENFRTGTDPGHKVHLHARAEDTDLDSGEFHHV
jgi:outer membrane murein-binding lipoprotein Lpp